MKKNLPKAALLSSQGLLFAHPADSSLIAGLDEAGRGCLAGPVVAAAVSFVDGFDILGLDDSKKLSPAERARLAIEIKSLARGWGIGLVWMRDIDTLNILQASLLAMARALAAMHVRMRKNAPTPLANQTNLLPPLTPDTPAIPWPSRLLIDGNQRIPAPYLNQYAIPPIPQETIIHGDATTPAIAAASILAKTTRDALMELFHTRYPVYNFAQHKGYGNPMHRQALQEHGPCHLHRLTFAGVVPKTSQQQFSLLGE